MNSAFAILEMPELETRCLSADEDLTGGAWKTINGARVYIKDGIAEYSALVHKALGASTKNLSLDAPDLETLNLSGEGDEEPHSYSCTHIELPPDIAAKVKGIADSIDPEDLHENGRENNFHVTVKYGLHGSSPATTKEALDGEMPVRFKMGGLKVFPANEKRNSDVLVAHVHSPDLDRLNRKISSATPHVDTYAKYAPHATIAYLKPGMGAKYAIAGHDLNGMEGMASEVVHADRYEKPTRIPLEGVSRGPSMLLSMPELETLNLDSSEDGGIGAHWVTIQGQAVRISGAGDILKGPPRSKPVTQAEHQAEAHKHTNALLAEQAKGGRANKAKLDEHFEAAKHHQDHANALKEKNDAEKRTTRSVPKTPELETEAIKQRTTLEKQHPGGVVPVDEEVKAAAKSGKLNVPTGKDGKIDPHLEAAYRRHAAANGLEIGRFEKEPGGGSVTARMGVPKMPAMETKAVSMPSRDDLDHTMSIKSESELKGNAASSKSSMLPGNERRYLAGQNRGSLKFASQHHEDLFDVGNAMNKDFTPPKAATGRLLEHFGGDEGAMKSAAKKAYSDVREQAKGLQEGETRAVKNRSIPEVPKMETKAIESGPEKEPTKADREKELIAHHESVSGAGTTSADDEAWMQSHSNGNPFMYQGEMPGEMKHIIEDNPATRKLFKRTDNRSEAGFEDAHGADPDRYEAIAGSLAGSPLKAALWTAENSPDPAIRLKVAIYKTLPQDASGMQSAATRAKNAVGKAGQNLHTPGERAQAQRIAQSKADHAQTQADAAKSENKGAEMSPVDNLPTGTKFEIHNIPVEVVDTPQGKAIRDHGDLPETPVDALAGQKLPIDKGSLRLAAPKMETAAIDPKNWGGSSTPPGPAFPKATAAQQDKFNASHADKAGDVLRSHLDRIKQFGEDNGNANFSEATTDYAGELRKATARTPEARAKNLESAHHLEIAAYHPAIVEHGEKGIEKAYPSRGKRGIAA